MNENGNDEPYLRKTKKAIENGAKTTIAIHVFGIPTTSFRDHLDGNIKSRTYIKKKVTLSVLEIKETSELGVGHVEHGPRPINITLIIEIQGY